MNVRQISRDVFGYLILIVLLGIIGWIETTHPAGLSLPGLTGGLLSLDTMIRVGMFTIVLVGLNLLMGYAGQVSLGQAAFYGMGAFFSAILTTRAGRLGVPVEISQAWWWAWIVMVGGMLFTATVAYVIGLPLEVGSMPR